MKKFIEVYDNIIPLTLSNQIEDFLISDKLPYYFSYNAVKKDSKKFTPAFFHSFTEINESFPTGHSFYIFNILYKFCFSKNIALHKILRARTHIQLPSISPQVHSPHIDDNNPHWVVLYYVNDSDGDTILYKDKTIIKKISPKKGRIVFFDGSIWHSASTPQKNIRSVINFNFIGEKG